MGKKKVNIFDKGDPEELFEKNECLGEGTYGTVWTGKELATDRTCAIKIVKLDDDLEEIEQEVAIMKEADSEYIVKFYGCYWGYRREYIWMVMEHCIAGSLNDLMYVCDTTLTEPQIKAVIAAMVLGLEYLHKNLIIHRDIKAGNVLLTGDGHVRLADFGVSGRMKNKSDRKTTAIGAPFWMAPEVILEKKYDGRADIWSVGITVIELAEARPPNSHINPMRALFLIPKSDPPTLQQPEKYSKHMVNFLRKCLTPNHNKRPTATALKKEPFIEKDINRFGQDGTHEEVTALVQSSLNTIQEWREEEFAAQNEEESDSDDDSLADLLGEMDGGEPQKAPVVPVSVKKLVAAPKAPEPLTEAPKFVNTAEAVKVRNTVHGNTRMYAPLRDVSQGPGGNKGRLLSSNQVISEDAVMNMMQEDGEDGENQAFAAVMTQDFIQLLKKIYDARPEAFDGDETGNLTGEALSAGITNIFRDMVGAELSMDNLDFTPTGGQEEFDEDQFGDSDSDEDGDKRRKKETPKETPKEPPPPPFVAAGEHGGI